MKSLFLILALLLFTGSASAATYFVRSDGSSATNCLGTTNAAYDGSGTGEACAFSTVTLAITAASCSDTIKALAGDSWDVSSPYSLTDKSCGAGTEITITTTASLPSARVSPALASSMPRFRATGSDGIFRMAANAGYWILDGLDLTDNSSVTVNYLVDVNTNSTGHHLTVQRCLLYPKEVFSDPTGRNRELARGVWFDGSFLTFKWNYGYGFSQRDGSGASQNTAIILTVSGNNLTITDNYMDGQYVAFFTGGGGEGPEYTGTVSSASTTSATFSSTTGLVDDVTYVRFELRGSGTFNSSTSFTRTSGQTPTSDDVNHTVFIVHGGGTWRAKITAVSGNNWTTESYGGPQPSVSESCTWTEYVVAKVTNFSGTTVTYDGSAATVGLNWLTQAPSTAANAASWRQNQVVHDIVITKNTFHIDVTLAQAEHTATGNNPKGWMELKAGDDILIDGNYFTGYPSCIGITQHSNEGWTPWTKVMNLTISNNFVNSIFDTNGSRQFIILALVDPYNSDEPGFNTTITNNLVLNCIYPIQFSGSATTSVTHNTFVNPYSSGVYGSRALQGEGAVSTGLTLTDNIVAYNTYGAQCFIDPFTLATCWPSGIWDHNVVVDNLAAGVTTSTWGTSSILSPIPTAFTQVGFVNTVINDYRLSAGSDFKGDGTGGTDPGVLWSSLTTALGFDPSAQVGAGPATVRGRGTIKGRVTMRP